MRFVLRGQREAAVPHALLVEMRAIMVLEQIGNAQARQVLARLAGGAASARVTEDARQALDRLPPHK